jgi:hypothetical protein
MADCAFFKAKRAERNALPPVRFSDYGVSYWLLLGDATIPLFISCSALRSVDDSY